MIFLSQRRSFPPAYRWQFTLTPSGRSVISRISPIGFWEERLVIEPIEICDRPRRVLKNGLKCQGISIGVS